MHTIYGVARLGIVRGAEKVYAIPMQLLHAFGGVLSLLLVVALGFALARLGWFPPPCRELLPKLVTNVSLPPFLACVIISSFQSENLAHMFYGALPPLALMIVLFALAFLTARIMKVDKRHFGLFCACVSNPNTIFIGIPVNMSLFGPESLPYVLLYYFASTFFFWTVGNYFISRDEGALANAPGFHWRRLLSPPMLGFLLGLGIVCGDIHPPDFIFNSARLVGDLTTPLALIFIGVTLEGIGLRNLRPDRDMRAALAGRMVLSPLLMWAALPLFGLPALMGKVFVIQSSLPTLMQVAILSAYYGTDPDFGSSMVALSTILCVFTIPVYMTLL